MRKPKYNLQKIISYLLGATLIIWFLKTYTAGKKLGINIGNDLANNNAASVITQMQNNNSINPTRIQSITKIADNIYNALYKYMFGMFEDEEAVIENMNQLLNVQEAIACARLYQASYGKQLRADIDRYLLPIERKDINTAYYNAINSI